MDVSSALGGWIEVELCSADPLGTISAAGKIGIPIYQAQFIDSMNLRFSLPFRQWKRFSSMAAKRGDKVAILTRRGAPFLLHKLFKRPVLVAGVLALLLISLWVPSRVLFVQIEGNDAVPTQLILEKAASCGIEFNASRRKVRSEQVKNALLQSMPELKWAGVNTYGCKAVITVLERDKTDASQKSASVSSIVSSQDAIIDSVTVLQGNALCKPGQAVHAGQMLVSGYQDCGLCIRAVEAKAEIFGYTQRKFTAVFPLQYQIRTNSTAAQKTYSLLIGKNRINFFKSSGISDTSCAKIYAEKYITLPGGWVLPFGVSVETVFSYDAHSETQEADETWLQAFAKSYLEKQMIAGRICSGKETLQKREDSCLLSGVYSCYEWLCVSQPEESLANHG